MHVGSRMHANLGVHLRHESSLHNDLSKKFARRCSRPPKHRIGLALHVTAESMDSCGNTDDKHAFLEEIRAVRKKKKELASEAIRLKMAGKLTAEEDTLLREALGNDHDKLIPPEAVLNFLEGLGLPNPGPYNAGEAQPAFVMPLMEYSEALDQELQIWKRNLQMGSTEGMDILKLAKEGSGSGDSYAGKLPLEATSLEEVLRNKGSDLDPGKLYFIDGVSEEEIAEMLGLDGVDNENLTERLEEIGEPLGAKQDYCPGISPDSIVNGKDDINIEEAGYTDMDDAEPEIGGPALDTYLAEIEAGNKIVLPEGNLPQEDFESYRRRIQFLKDHYEDQFRKPRDRKCSAEESKKLEQEFRRLRNEEGLNFDGTTPIPVDMSWDTDNRRLAPEAPPEVEQRFDRSAWLQFLLRRAHMSKDPMEPGRRLLEEGLLEHNCNYGDPVMVLKGAPRWLAMLDCLSSSGAYSQAASIFVVQTDEELPNHYIVVDYFLNLQVPKDILADTAKSGLMWVDREREREGGKISIGLSTRTLLSSAHVLTPKMAISIGVEFARIVCLWCMLQSPLFVSVLPQFEMYLIIIATVDDATLEECFEELKHDGIGCDWQDNIQVCTIGVTTKYSIGGNSGKIENIDSCFGFVAGSLPLKAFKPLYISSCGGITKDEFWDGKEVQYMYHNHPRNRERK